MKIDCSKESNRPDIKAILETLIWLACMAGILYLGTHHNRGILAALIWLGGYLSGMLNRKSTTTERIDAK